MSLSHSSEQVESFVKEVGGPQTGLKPHHDPSPSKCFSPSVRCTLSTDPDHFLVFSPLPGNKQWVDSGWGFSVFQGPTSRLPSGWDGFKLWCCFGVLVSLFFAARNAARSCFRREWVGLLSGCFCPLASSSSSSFVFSAFSDNFRTFFRHFSDILSTFPFSGLSNDLPVTILEVNSRGNERIFNFFLK